MRIAATPMRTIGVLTVVSLLMAACGSRLTEEQRRLAVGAQPDAARTAAEGTSGGAEPAGGGGSGDLEFNDGSSSASGGGAADGSAAGETGGGAAAGGGQESGTAGGGEAAPAGDTGGSGAAGTGAAGSGGSEGSGGSGGDAAGGGDSQGSTQPRDTREAPPGGNGGATDVGVTEDTIVLSNVSDVSGAVPGLFEPSQLAAKAYLKYFEATEGTLYGRRLQYLPLDTKLDTRGARNASIEACDRSFASIGSTSAMDQGAAPVVDECGLADIRALSTTRQMKAVDNAYPTDAITERVEPIGQYRWIRQQHPEAVKKAAYLFIAGEVTEQSTGRTRDATSQELGYRWEYVQPIEISETNYSPFVVEMKDMGIEYVTFQGAYQQGVRLAQAMRKQGFEPTVYQLQSNAYQNKTIAQGGEAVEGTYIGLSSVMVEEAERYPELQNYTQALQAVEPGARPTSIGMYAWSASKLFVEIAKKIGPELTRGKIIDEVATVEGWTGGGLHPPEDIAGRWPSACFVMTQIQDGTFTRVHPQEGFDCDGPTIDMR